METTGELIRRAQQGNVQAVNELYCRYSPRVLALVRRRMGPGLRLKEQSSDLMQETLLKTLRGLENFVFYGDHAWVAYLAKRVEQTVRDKVEFWNAAKRNPMRELPFDRFGKSGSATRMAIQNEFTASGIFERNEDIQRLYRAMDRLRIKDEESWVLIRALRMDGHSYAKIAKQRGVSADSIRKKYYRARKTLKRYFLEVA